jgi:acetyl esterase
VLGAGASVLAGDEGVVMSTSDPIAQPVLPGRLSVADRALRDDPRADPRMIAALAPLGMADVLPPSPIHADTPIEAILDFVAEMEPNLDALPMSQLGEVVPVEGVTSSTEVIRGIDGNDITLYIHRPAGERSPLPAVLHLHGGGMVFLEAAGPGYVRWRDELAATGLVVVGVEFRNGAGKHGPFPFPAGLNDCSSALQWLGAHRDDLGVSAIIVSGESGGGNLTLATALKANRDGQVGLIDGVYAQCPYISNAYAHKRPDLVSLYENDGYVIDCRQAGALAKAYDPDGANARNPLAWPLHAQRSDLEGLPPHVISVNELDPLRDEGLAYFRMLLDAGVSAIGRTVNGTCHAADCLFVTAMPEVYRSTIRDIKSFADSL